jgi:hypothetical protein
LRKSSTSLLSTAVALVAVVLPAAPAVAAVGAPAAHAITAPRAVSSTDAINAHYAALGGGRSFLGNPVGGETAVAGGFSGNGAGASIYWTPKTGAQSVRGAIRAHWQALGWETGPMGYPVTDETGTPDGTGRFNHFTGKDGTGASIYWTPRGGAWSVRGAIRQHWASLGWEVGPMGYPTTDELGTPDGVGRFNHFDGSGDDASIYWTPKTGAQSVEGPLRAHWQALGWETGPLGYPTTDLQATPDGLGYYNHFAGKDGTGASIYWTFDTGAWSVQGAIRAAWAGQGWEVGPLGYPISDEYAVTGGRQNDFTGGTITWNAATGHITITTHPVTVPATVADLAATPANHGATLTFTAPANNGGAISGYDYTLDGGDSWNALDSTTEGSAVTGTVAGLTNGTAYNVNVRASNSAGAGAISNTATVTPAAVPAAVDDLTAEARDSGASVSFTAPADNGSAITGYEYQLDGGTWTTLNLNFVISSLLSNNNVTGVITGLTNGTAYNVNVRAVNGEGNGPASNTATVTPAAAPAAATDLTATFGNSSVALTFTAPADNGAAISGYEVSTTGSDGPWNGLEYSASGGTITATVTGLTNDASYTVLVRAINSAGIGQPSNSVTGTPTAQVPSTIADLTAQPGNGRATLGFTAPADNGATISGYEVSVNGSWTELTTSTNGSTVTGTVTGLTNGTSYSLRVRAINSAGNGNASNAVTVVPAPAAPGTVQDLTATRGGHSATLTFTAPSDNGTAIQRYEYTTNAGTSWAPLTGLTASGPQLTTTVTNDSTGFTLANGTTYPFQVRADNAVGNGEPSNIANVTPAAAPAAVTDLSAAPGNGSATLTFTAPATNGAPITGYEYLIGGFTNNWTPLNSTTTGGTVTGTVTGLTNGTTYNVQVRADNSAGNGPASGPVPVTPAPLAPSAVADLTATPGDSSATLTFTAPADNGGTITGYYYSLDGTSWDALTGATTSSLGTETATISGLTNGSPYGVQVRAVNGVDGGPWSNTATVTPAAAPAAVTNLTSTFGNTTAALSFTAPANNGASITGYQVSADGGTNWNALTTSTSGSTVTGTVTGLTNGTTYSLQVRAINSAGNGPASNSTTVTPATVPAPVTNLTGQPGNGSAALSFTPPANNGASITGYQVSTDGGTNWNALTTSTSGSTVTGTVTGLTNGTAYNIKVRAINLAGAGAGSNTATVTPAPQVPSAIADLSATRGDGSAVLTFTTPAANGAAITQYRYWNSSTGWNPLTTTTSGSTTTGTATGLTNGTAYGIYVEAQNSAGYGNLSNYVTVTPAAVPATVSDLTAQSGNGSAALAFTAPADNGSAITGYEFTTNGTSWTSLTTTTAGSTVTGTATGLTNGTTYTIGVRAINDVGHGATSNTPSVTPLATVPVTVGDLTATAGDGSVALSFTPPNNGGSSITKYEYATDGGTSWLQLTTLVPQGTRLGESVSFDSTGVALTNGQSYTFVVRADNSVGNGANSNAATVTPGNVAP